MSDFATGVALGLSANGNGGPITSVCTPFVTCDLFQSLVLIFFIGTILFLAGLLIYLIVTEFVSYQKNKAELKEGRAK